MQTTLSDDTVHVFPEFLNGELEPVAVIAERLTGVRPSPPACIRWVRSGLRKGRVKLAAIHHSGKWRTTEAAFLEFIRAQTAAAMGEPLKQSPDCDSELQAAGLL